MAVVAKRWRAWTWRNLPLLDLTNVSEDISRSLVVRVASAQAALPKLQSLSLCISSTDFAEIVREHLSTLASLEHLALYSNTFASFDFAPGALPNLKSLILSDFDSIDFGPIGRLPSLVTLHVSGGLTFLNLAFLRNLAPRLRDLAFTDTHQLDVLDLRELLLSLSNLETLNLSGTAVGPLEAAAIGDSGAPIKSLVTDNCVYLDTESREQLNRRLPYLIEVSRVVL